MQLVSVHRAARFCISHVNGSTKHRPNKTNKVNFPSSAAATAARLPVKHIFPTSAKCTFRTCTLLRISRRPVGPHPRHGRIGSLRMRIAHSGLGYTHGLLPHATGDTVDSKALFARVLTARYFA